MNKHILHYTDIKRENESKKHQRKSKNLTFHNAFQKKFVYGGLGLRVRLKAHVNTSARAIARIVTKTMEISIPLC